ncbi:KipI family sensor histidine kinase inhibitor [Arthrobacter sp. CAN_A214]|uniref:5-oxoprolinase subunit B/C family protein n=1 Tax=Arthrobacter sp. CAN_A214 TaxID=2787720 RepID=UPI0018C9F845
MSSIAVRWAGPRAVLAEVSTLPDVLALHRRLTAQPLPGQLDAVAGARTVLVRFSGHEAAVSAAAALPHLDPPTSGRPGGREVTIEVVYDGVDLDEVGRLTGLGRDGVISAHTGQPWSGAFGGFAPGFTYLVGEDRRLHVPRRTTPRTAVPAGSVALGGEFSAIYPRRSPGGWQIIGTTAARMWDLEREQPALVRPGDTVRYRAVRELADLGNSATPSGKRREPAGPDAGLEVASAGLLSLLQDLGRPGNGDLGVSPSGAADQPSARQANRLVGNQAGAAVVENLLGGLSLRAHGDQVVAVTGAPVPLRVSGPGTPRKPAMGHPFALLDGDLLALGTPTAGLRSYVAVRGGFDVLPVLGSRSSDTLSGIGPAPLAPGAVLPVGAVRGLPPVGSPEETMLRLGAGTMELRITLGPRNDWFTDQAIKALLTREWRVTNQSNRVGVRLAVSSTDPARTEEAGVLERARSGELPSEGTVVGALQVPPSGQPVLFLADQPVTGGYPVIGVVAAEDVSLAAQLPPGQLVRFLLVDPATLAPSAMTAG